MKEIKSSWVVPLKWLISREYIILDPVISDYIDFRDVMKIAFEMYEDFKQAFIKIAKNQEFKNFTWPSGSFHAKMW